MILIDRPYVSDFLIRTLKDNGYPVVATPEAQALIPDKDIHWITDEKAMQRYLEDAHLPVYSNSENAIGWIERHLPDSDLARNIRLFKDKAAFRELTSDIFPDFFFQTVRFQDLDRLQLKDLPFPFVIKPSVGFFSLDVHVVNDPGDWEKVKYELQQNLSQQLFPKTVLDTSSFILEEYIEGEEYAVDCYFNKDGEVVILNILHHRFSSGSDTSDRVYYGSREVINSCKEPVTRFLRKIGKKTGLRNFPLHIEIRMDREGNIRPIEVNPLRFGGWCTTGDMAWFAYGINSYEYFMEGKAPDWQQIFQGKEEKIFSIIVLNNNSGIDPEQINYFDYRMLEQDFENVLTTRELSITDYPLFGFLFTETSPENKIELEHILNSDLRKYIKLK